MVEMLRPRRDEYVENVVGASVAIAGSFCHLLSEVALSYPAGRGIYGLKEEPRFMRQSKKETRE